MTWPIETHNQKSYAIHTPRKRDVVVPIKSVKLINKPTIVYNLETSSHDYIVPYRVHNSIEDEKGEPFVGPSGQLLRRCLKDAGFDPLKVSYVNTYSCKYSESPREEYIEACSPNKWNQLDYLSPDWLIIAGSIALHSMLPDVKISAMRGRPFKLGMFKCYTIYHPSAGLRNGNYERMIEEDLAKFREVIDSSDWMEFISDLCMYCKESAVWIEDSGLGYCVSHAPKEYHVRQELLKKELEEIRSGT